MMLHSFWQLGRGEREREEEKKEAEKRRRLRNKGTELGGDHKTDERILIITARRRNRRGRQ